MRVLQIKALLKRKKRSHSRRAWIASIVVVILITGALAIIEFAPSLVANFADNVLRPVIGNQTTIALEAVALSLSDQIKQVAYGTLAKPSGNIYNAEPAGNASTTPAKAVADNSTLTKAQALDLTTLTALQPTFTKLAGEGEWTLVSLPQFQNRPLMAKTFVRPDPVRSYAIVALVQMNMHELHLHAVAGTQYPGGELGHHGPGVIPAQAVSSNTLVAGFNGGFQYKDGHYGMAVGPTTYVPLQPGTGTLTINQDGTLTINRYNPTVAVSKPAEAIRQNGPLILDNAAVTSDAISGGYSVWGRTTTNSIYTWRSGVGLTKNGNLIYAVGPSLTAATLAEALRAGGAVQAMQLDINAFWVRFVTFTPTGPGTYSFESILSTLSNGGSSYLHGYNKDFFYATLNQPISK
jgi:Phosphodiester glycosidase